MTSRKATWLRKAALCVLLLDARAQAAESADMVTWCQFDLPPMYIVDGPDANKGSVDGHVKFLIKHMPEYQHQIQFSNIRRVSEQIRNHEHVVCAGMQRNEERESYMLFSLPFIGALSPTLILPHRNLDQVRPYLDAAGKVRLAALVENSPMVIGIASGRSYGRDIDATMLRFKDRPNVVLRPAGQDLMVGLIKMMSLGRIDYTIAYGSELNTFTKGMADSGHEVVSLPIEGMPDYIPIYITAPSDAWGHAFIEHVNQLLRTYWNNSEFRVYAFVGQTPAQREATKAILRDLAPTAVASASAHARR